MLKENPFIEDLSLFPLYFFLFFLFFCLVISLDTENFPTQYSLWNQKPVWPSAF